MAVRLTGWISPPTIGTAISNSEASEAQRKTDTRSARVRISALDLPPRAAQTILIAGVRSQVLLPRHLPTIHLGAKALGETGRCRISAFEEIRGLDLGHLGEMSGHQEGGISAVESCAIDTPAPDLEMGLNQHSVEGPRATLIIDPGSEIELGPTGVVQHDGRQDLGAGLGTIEAAAAPVLRQLPGEPGVRGLRNRQRSCRVVSGIQEHRVIVPGIARKGCPNPPTTSEKHLDSSPSRGV